MKRKKNTLNFVFADILMSEYMSNWHAGTVHYDQMKFK